MLEILLIEDTPADADRTVRALRQAEVRCRVRVAESGEEALRLLHRPRRSRRPDLILLDWYLPKKDGREVLEEIKGDPELCPIPIVILSVSDHEGDISAAYDRYANSFVTKPADLDQFAQVMKFVAVFWTGPPCRRSPAEEGASRRGGLLERDQRGEAQTQTRRRRPPATRRG
jgi:CheY-like chemotaxis protein